MTTLNELLGEASTKPTGPTNPIEPTVNTPATDTENDSETVDAIVAPAANQLPSGPTNTNAPPIANDLPTGAENSLSLSAANTQDGGPENNLAPVAASILPASLLNTLNAKTNVLLDVLIESGLIFHLKADNLPVLADGAVMGALTETSENENTLSGNSIYIAADPYGKPAIGFRRFTGLDAYSTGLSIGPKATIFAVFAQRDELALPRGLTTALFNQKILYTGLEPEHFELRIEPPSTRVKTVIGTDGVALPNESDGWNEDRFVTWAGVQSSPASGVPLPLSIGEFICYISGVTTARSDPHLRAGFLSGTIGITSGPSGNGSLLAGEAIDFKFNRPVELQHIVFGGFAIGEEALIEIIDDETASVLRTIPISYLDTSNYTAQASAETRFYAGAFASKETIVRERETLRISCVTGTLTLFSLSLNEAAIPVAGHLPQTYITAEDFINGRRASKGGSYIKEGFNVLCSSIEEMPIGDTLFLSTNFATEKVSMDLRELLIFNRVLSSNERAQMTRLLSREHGIDAIEIDETNPVDRVNTILGASQIGSWDGTDRFDFGFAEDRNLTLDCAKLAYQRGASVFKFALGPDNGNLQTVDTATSLLTLARDNAVARAILDIPFPDLVLWAYTIGVMDWRYQSLPLSQGYIDTVKAEWRALAEWLLTTYNGSGRRFFLGDWEGDWMVGVLGSTNPETDVTTNKINAHAAWITARQEAIDDAKAAHPESDVQVWNFTETNKTLWGLEGRKGVINSVLPLLPKLDYISVSANEFRTMSESEVHQALNLVQSRLPALGGPSSGTRMMIGEYNINRDNLSDSDHAQLYKDFWAKLFEWDGSGLEFILHWKYAWRSFDGTGDIEDSCHVDGSGALNHIGKLHVDFQEKMRTWQRAFYRGNGRSSTWQEIRLKAEEIVPTLTHS